MKAEQNNNTSNNKQKHKQWKLIIDTELFKLDILKNPKSTSTNFVRRNTKWSDIEKNIEEEIKGKQTKTEQRNFFLK